MIHIPVVPNPFFALLQQKFSAAFTSRTKPDRSDNLISNNEIAAEMSMFSILCMLFCLVLKRTRLAFCMQNRSFRLYSNTAVVPQKAFDKAILHEVHSSLMQNGGQIFIYTNHSKDNKKQNW